MTKHQLIELLAPVPDNCDVGICIIPIHGKEGEADVHDIDEVNLLNPECAVLVSQYYVKDN